MPTIDEILDEVEHLDREATPGSWLCGELSDGTRRVYPDDMEEDEHGCFPCVCEYAKDADAALIAAYRSHAPALAAEVRRLRGLLEQHSTITIEEARSLLDNCAPPDEIARRRQRSRERLAERTTLRAIPGEFSFDSFDDEDG